MAAIAGCADVDSDVLTKDQFVQRADELCAEMGEKSGAAAKPPATEQEGLEQLRREGARLEQLDVKLRSFRISPELEAAMEPFFTADADLIELNPRLARAYEEGDEDAAARLQQEAAAATGVRQEAATAVGLKVCGQPPKAAPPPSG